MSNKGYCYKKKPSRGLARTYLSKKGGETDDIRKAKKITEEEYLSTYSTEWFFQSESRFTEDEEDSSLFPFIKF